MKRRDLIKLLEKNGWWYKRSGGNPYFKCPYSSVFNICPSLIFLYPLGAKQ